MNITIINSTNEELLQKSVGAYVVVKFTSGRVVSGILLENNDSYTIKLGVKKIPVEIDNISKITF